jgi:hypothetical protein
MIALHESSIAFNNPARINWTRADTMESMRTAFTVVEFCSAHRISRAKLYELWRAGRGPKTMNVGCRKLISVEAAAEWRRQMESGGSASKRGTEQIGATGA